MNYKTSAERERTAQLTGVYVRAIGADGSWGSYDMAHLDRESLISFIHSRGEVNGWAESLILILMGHRD